MSDPAHDAELPTARTSNGNRVIRLIVLIGAGFGAVAAVYSARQYERPEPQPEPKAPGMTVGKDSVTSRPARRSGRSCRRAPPCRPRRAGAI